MRPRRRLRLAAAFGVLMATGLLAVSSTAQLAPMKGALAAPPTCPPKQERCKTPTPTPTPSPCANAPDSGDHPCSSPTPDTVVISPVPADPPSPALTPAYLIGLSPSPSTAASDVGGAIAPLGGGTTDNQPSPGSGGGGAAETVKSTGLPVPLLLAMLVLASIGGGFLLWRFGPRGQRLPNVKPAPPILFTPYGSESRTTANLLDPSVNRPPD